MQQPSANAKKQSSFQSEKAVAVAYDSTDKMNESTAGEAIEIALSIVDISIEVLDDFNGTNIPVLVTDVLDSVSCTTAETFLSGSSQNGKTRAPFFKRALGIGRHKENSEAVETAEKIQKQVTRFLRIPDKYVSFTSVLLKSQAFHMTYPSHCNDVISVNEGKETAESHSASASPLPVTVIPRTPYKKPYIPKRPLSDTTTSQNAHNQQEEVNLYPLSISHQFPFVGMARLKLVDSNHHHPCRPLVGLDIVTFDDYNSKLYNSLADFVHVFHESFTPWEWTCIQHAFPEGKMLEEFYLRWAIKESYTKALGVGMGLPFDSFETRLEFAVHTGNDNGKEDQGIFEWMCRQAVSTNDHSQSNNDNKDGPSTMLKGSVVVNPGTPKATSEPCSFYFKPLWELDVYGSKRSWENVRGCACICIISQQSSSTPDDDTAALDLINGPHLRGSGAHKTPTDICVTTGWQSLEDLISWHRR